MRMHRGWLAFVVLGLVPAAVASDKADIDRVLSAAREQSLVMEHLDHLSNRIGPRLTGSDGLQDACEWAVDRFKDFGIENARLEKWGEFPVGFNRGPWSGRMVEPSIKELTFGTNSWTAGTRGVVRGPAVMAPTTDEELAKVKDKLPGAWVLTPTGGIRGLFGPGPFGEKLAAAYAEAKIAGQVRSARGELILTGGNFKVDWEKLPTTPTINLVRSQFDEIAALIKEDKPVVLEFDVRNYFKKGPIPLYNVIADIPGTQFPDEYVLVGGHLDSWDGATGTTDNGTGCATTLEAARILMKAGVKPKRTIRFILWSGEEQGLMGSRAYIKAHPELLKAISAVLIHDGGTNYLSGIASTKAMKADLDEVFAPVTGLDAAMPFKVREVGRLPLGIGSDHDSFLVAGVPGFFWNQAGKVNYNHAHHTQHDTFEIAIPEYQKHSATIVALGAMGVADLDHLLSREGLTAVGGNRGGNPNRRLAGLELDELKVEGVVEGGAAEKAGFKVGDEILKVAGNAVTGREEFSSALQGAGTERVVVVKRDGKEVELKLTFPPKP